MREGGLRVCLEGGARSTADGLHGFAAKVPGSVECHAQDGQAGGGK